MSKPVPSRLGRGLSTLIAPTTRTPPLEIDSDGGRRIPIDAIDPNPAQPRASFSEERLRELASSIQEKGILQPILVRPRPDDRYELVAGERRWRAAQLAGLKEIPAVVRDLTDIAAAEIALIENVQREDLEPLERAAAYRTYIERFDSNPDILARKLGESRASVANYLRLLKLPGEIQNLIKNGELGMGQARAIAGVEDPQRRLALARLAARRRLSVRQVEALVRAAAESNDHRQGGGSPALAKTAEDRHLHEIARMISKTLGLSATLEPGRKRNSGRVIIRYESLDEFDRIAARLGVSLTE